MHLLYIRLFTWVRTHIEALFWEGMKRGSCGKPDYGRTTWNK